MTDNLPPLPSPKIHACRCGVVHADFDGESMEDYARAAIAQAQSLPVAKAADQRVTFDTWLRSVCFQAPPDHAQDLARSAWYASDKQASADCEAMAEEIERLQKALAFWMPDVPSTDHPLFLRVVHDVYLLVGYDGPNNEPSAFELGHVALAESQTNLWAIHVPGPDDYYPAPSEEAASHMASKHNAAMAEWNKANPDTSGNRPPIESSMASAQRWPGSATDHAEEIAVFDYAAWGLASPQPQPVQPSDPWMPIKTAPTGAKVLLFSPDFTTPSVGDWGHYCKHNHPNFTHWMPLPDAPKPKD